MDKYPGASKKISIHALREEGDARQRCCSWKNRISIHALREEGDLFLRCSGGGVLSISIHALREEGDRTGLTLSVIISNFYPRPPRGGRRPRSDRCCPAMRFLSTPSARRATDGRYRCGRAKHISIHALREEGDFKVVVCGLPFDLFLSTPSARRATAAVGGGNGDGVISIHALREEGDASHPNRSQSDCRFLSTPSARRATRLFLLRSSARA